MLEDKLKIYQFIHTVKYQMNVIQNRKILERNLESVSKKYILSFYLTLHINIS